MSAASSSDGGDEFVPGSEWRGGSRTITDAEVAFLPALMGAVNPLFHDEVTARSGPTAGRVLYGPALLGISIALTEHFLRRRVIALAGIDAVRFRKVVRVGDTVTASFTVDSCLPRRDKPHLVLTLDDAVTNQAGEVVLTFRRAILVRLTDRASASE